MTILGREFGLMLPTVSRQEWEARWPRRRENLLTPVPIVRFTTTDSPPCETHEQVKEEVQDLQELYMEHLSKIDIPWNFLIGPDGFVYKGRGWYVQPDTPRDHEHIRGKFLSIAFIGTFDKEDPPWVMMKLAVEMIQFGVLSCLLSPAVHVLPFRNIYR